MKIMNLLVYELNYPEKRLFFQEGNEMYSTRIKTFYSRRIQDILYGAKLNGKAGKYNFNAMNVRTLQSSEDGEPPSFFTTARVKRDFLESSSVGLTAVDRRNDSSFVTSISGDYVLNLGETWKLTGQFVASMPGDLLSHSAWFVRFAKETNYYHMHVRYTELGENFQENVNQTGYVVDDDRREIDGDISYRWWLRNSVFQYIEVNSRNNIFWARTTGDLRSWYITQAAELYLQNRFSLAYSFNNEYKLFDKEKLSAQYSGDLICFTPDEDNLSTFINVGSLNYNFTKDLWIRVFAQNSTSSSKVYFYGMTGWRFKPPFGAVYLIYSYDREAELMGDLAHADALFIKLTLPIAIIR